jgi:hypothetical protein
VNRIDETKDAHHLFGIYETMNCPLLRDSHSYHFLSMVVSDLEDDDYDILTFGSVVDHFHNNVVFDDDDDDMDDCC